MKARRDIETGTGEVLLITYKQAMKRYSLGLSTVIELAKESNALIKIGKSARINVQKMDDYLLNNKAE